MRISDWSSDVCSSDLINATLPESPTKKAPRVRSRWGALCNERERARRPGIAQSYRALTSSGSYPGWPSRSEEHTSELQSLMRISYAVFCLKKKKKQQLNTQTNYNDIQS